MKNITTWLAAGAIVAAAAAGCTVEATSTGTTGGSGGTGATGGSGGSTGGSAGSGGTAGTGGASGSAGAAGNAGSGGAADAGSEAPVVMCTTNPNDPACNRCAFNKCQMEHCACNAVSTCRTPMLAFYMCLSMPNADEVACGATFVINANVDGSGGGLANDLAECMLNDCADTCAGRDASVRNRNLVEDLKAALGHSNQR